MLEKSLIVVLSSILMFIMSSLAGCSTIWIAAKAQSISEISLYGAGLLIGVSLAIIIPEGMHSLYHSSFNKMKTNYAGN